MQVAIHLPEFLPLFPFFGTWSCLYLSVDQIFATFWKKLKKKNCLLTSEQNEQDLTGHCDKNFDFVAAVAPFFTLHFSGMQSFGNSQKNVFCLLQFSSLHL